MSAIRFPFICAGILLVEGILARDGGVDRSSNPYEAGSVAAATWLAGWDQADEEAYPSAEDRLGLILSPP